MTYTKVVNGVRREMTAEEIEQRKADEAAAALAAQPDPHPDLTPSRFEYLLAMSGGALSDVWDALEVWSKDNDETLYATLRANRKALSFNLDKTLAVVQQTRPVLASVAPNFTLTDDEIRAAWATAAVVEF